ncbi:hypothetical protein OHA25_57210 [Nonomuraea sp. NBC_00507]|uniref:hypothetical protein n=1 Tax=Nonomuraea sp. NBC_00507 TaxID=2976002 RepID=UPI002E18C17C
MNNNFDWFVGSWTSQQRRLREVLVGCDDWYEFTGMSTCWSALGGAGHIDEVTFPELGTGGVTLRLYDKERDEWALYWATSKSGLSLPPVVGRFGDDGRGIFLADESYQGKQIKVRYMWLDITASSARWEQAFSTDGGITWETNWIAEFTRAS